MNFSEAKKNLIPENNIRIGRFLKTHANKGKISAKIYFELSNTKTESIFVKFNNYLVPFFIDFNLSNLDSYPQILKLQDIDSIDDAKKFNNKQIYLPIEIIKHNPNSIIDFENITVGFHIYTTNQKSVGKIINYNEDKKNPLWEVETDEGTILLPVNAIKINETKLKEKKLLCYIPQELLKL